MNILQAIFQTNKQNVFFNVSCVLDKVKMDFLLTFWKILYVKKLKINTFKIPFKTVDFSVSKF